MQTRLAKTLLPTHPSLIWPDGSPVRALGVSRAGRLIWPVHGGAPDDDKTFTQEDVNRMTAEARDRGKREAATSTEQAKAEAHRDFLKAAGLPEDTKPEDVQKALKAARDKELETLGEVERAKKEAEDAKADLVREREAVAKRDAERDAQAFGERVTSLIKEAGVGKEHEKDPEKRDAAVADVRRLLEVKQGADSDEIRKALTGLKERWPALFPTEENDDTGGAGGGLPDGRPGGGPGSQRASGKSNVAKGAEIAIARGWKKPAEKAS